MNYGSLAQKQDLRQQASFGKNSDWVQQQAKKIGSLSWKDLLAWVHDLEEAKSQGDLQAKKDLSDLWYWRLATDVELFAVAYFPHYCQLSFNEFHSEDFASIGFMERAIRRARAAPRGYAKSTLKGLIKPIHDVCYRLEKYIVFFSSNQDQASQKLRDIRSEVLTNNELAADYGVHFRTRKPGETSFVVWAGNHSVLFAGYGAGVEVRGIRFGTSRPTKVVVDDSENSEEVDSEALRKKHEDWFFQVVSQIGTKETNIEVIGTVLHRESFLKKLLRNPAYDGKLYKSVIEWSTRQDLWDRWQTIYTNLDNPTRMSEAEQFFIENKPAMLQGTKVLWEDKESYYDLMKELIEKGKRAFFKEKQNEPIGDENSIFEKLHYFRESKDGVIIESSGAVIPWEFLKDNNGKWLNAFGVIDPATGQEKRKRGSLGDFSCVLTGIKDNVGRLLIWEDWTRRAAPTKYINEVFEFHERYNYQKFGVETNLYRNLLLPNFVAERKRRGLEKKKEIQLPFYDIENVENKHKRIFTLEPKTTHGWILFNRTLSQEFFGQLEVFPNPDANDDGPDALEMLWGLVNNRFKPCALSIEATGGR